MTSENGTLDCLEFGAKIRSNSPVGFSVVSFQSKFPEEGPAGAFLDFEYFHDFI